MRSSRRAGGWTGGSAAGAGRVTGRGDVACRGRGSEAALPRGGRFPISRAPRPAAAGELPAGSTRRRDTGGGGGRVSRGRARGSQQRAGSTAVGLRREDLRRDQRDVRQRIRRRDGRGAPIGRLAGTALRTLR